MPTPSETFKQAQTARHEAKRAETRALWALPEPDLKTELARIRRRTVRGTKEVEVDYEIDADDLEELGYHHKDDCPAPSNRHDVNEPDDLAARRTLSDWHDDTHGNQLWSMCHQQPCNQLPHDFRSTP